MAKRALLASYGGGHAHIIATLARALKDADYETEIIGFTTAYQFFKRQGLDANSVVSLLDTDKSADEPYRLAVQPFLGGQSHPDISAAETEAYFTLGLRALAEEHGLDAALGMVRAKGRTAFKPVSAIERYLRRTKPDVVITTTSPRFEHAMLQAARRVGIPSLAVSDLFLVHERNWIVSGDYAEHLTVISPLVAQELRDAGLEGTEIHVTGNPVFDSLLLRPEHAEIRTNLRKKLGIDDKKVVLWPSAVIEDKLFYGRACSSVQAVVNAFERLCQTDPAFIYLVRPHPNSPFELPAGAAHGILDWKLLTSEEALLVSDVVCVELSTMGLQAALMGKPVICVAFDDVVSYPEYGLAKTAANVEEAVNTLLSGDYVSRATAEFGMPPLGTATQRIIDLVESIA